MSNTLLVPWNIRHQFRLLSWLFLHPARFADYTQNAAAETWNRELCALLLPDDRTALHLTIIQKFSVGVTARRDYRGDFAAVIRRHFRVPDHQFPEHVVVHYRSNTPGPVSEEVRHYVPAAYALIRRRRRIDAQVQRASGWLGTTLALLPALLLVVADLPLDFGLLLALGMCAGVVWTAFGLAYKKEDFVADTWQEGLRGWAGGTACVVVLALLSAAAHHAALERQAFGLAAAGVAMGISGGVCSLLPVRHPFALWRCHALAVVLGITTAFIGAERQDTALLAFVVPAAAFGLGSRWTLKRGIRLRRGIPVNRALWAVLGGAHGALVVYAAARVFV